MNLVLVGSLVEHDSGNIEEYKHKIAEAIANAARGLATMAGVPAEALAADQGSSMTCPWGGQCRKQRCGR